MSRISTAFTIPVDHSPLTLVDAPDIHARPTRILKRWRADADTRATAVSTVTSPGTPCATCTSLLEIDAQFCGMCGSRVRARPSLVGVVVDELYRVDACIARGATTTIYRACYLPSGTEVALKVLHPELAYDQTAVQRFRREGRCLSRLRDPRTVVVFDHGEAADGTLYIAMELLRGEALDVRLRARGAMPWRTTLSIMRGISAALGEAHSHGIVHRNLGTSNVMLLGDDTVKLIDFGLAKLRSDETDEDLTSVGQAIGVLRPSAPEHREGRTSDHRADLYALGVLGLELLLGRPPLGEPHTLALPTGTPPLVAALLRRCVATEPDARFATAAELANAIEQALRTSDTGIAAATAPVRPTFGHTSAFELQPPRIVIAAAPQPAFLARGSEPEIPLPSTRGRRWKLWAVALIVCGVGLGTAVAGCV